MPSSHHKNFEGLSSINLNAREISGIFRYIIVLASASDINLNILPPQTAQVPLAEYLPLSFLVTTGFTISLIVGLLLVLHFIHKACNAAIKKLIKLLIL